MSKVNLNENRCEHHADHVNDQSAADFGFELSEEVKIVSNVSITKFF